MTSTQDNIVRAIKSHIHDAEVTITDLRGDGEQYALHVKSGLFQNMSRLEQHKMVYKSLENKIKTDEQALAIQTAVKEG